MLLTKVLLSKIKIKNVLNLRIQEMIKNLIKRNIY